MLCWNTTVPKTHLTMTYCVTPKQQLYIEDAACVLPSSGTMSGLCSRGVTEELGLIVLNMHSNVITGNWALLKIWILEDVLHYYYMLLERIFSLPLFCWRVHLSSDSSVFSQFSRLLHQAWHNTDETRGEDALTSPHVAKCEVALFLAVTYSFFLQSKIKKVCRCGCVCVRVCVGERESEGREEGRE